MFRRLASAGLALLLGLSVAPLLGSTPAAAAQAGVLTAHWWSGDKAGGHVKTATVATGTSGGAEFRNAYATYIRVHPPTGARFEGGRSYEAASSRTAEQAGIAQHGYSTCTSSQWTGTIDVAAATYDESGVLTRLAASYTGQCTSPGGRTDVVAGDLRLDDATPYAALLPTYASEPVAIGHERGTTATLTASGQGSITLGAASVVGTDKDDYRVTANGCAGVTLTGTETCDVAVAFAPRAKATGVRLARLVVETPGSLAGSVSVALDAKAVVVPEPPRVVTPFPISGGVGLTWLPSMNGAEVYHVERRWSTEGAWADLADVEGGGSRQTYIDHDVAPGQHVEYRVTGENSGWRGESVTTSTARPDSVLTPDATSALAVASADTADTAAVFRSTDADTTVDAWGGDNPQIRGDRHGGTMSSTETFYAPPVPGPGVYRLSSGQAGSVSGSMSDLNCTRYTESVLRVHDVLFDEALKPLVYDASWTALCDDGTVARAEIRLGTDRDVALTTATPMTPDLLTTHNGTPVSRTVKLGNRGPLAVEIGTANVAGDAAADWAVGDNTCSGTTLAAGEMCTLEVRFATTSAGTRNARLEVAMADSSGSMAPHVVLLKGRGAVVPTKTPWLYAHGMLAGVRVYWREPVDDGGYPVDHYEIRRRPLGSTGLGTSLGTTEETAFYDSSVSADDSFEYLVRAVNEVGPGPWNSADGGLATLGVVVEGETGADRPRSLFMVSAVNGSPPAVPMAGPVTHDHRDPAVSPGGTMLVYSRSADPGLGADGEYDLWRSSIHEAFGGTAGSPLRLTDLPGAERDAAVSPDASTVAFTHVDSAGASSVWVVPTAGGAAVELVGNAAEPAWMPSGDAVLVADTAGGMLKEVPITGDGPLLWEHTLGGTEPTVSRAGKLAFIDRDGNLVEMMRGESPTVRRSASSQHSYTDPAYSATGSLLVTHHYSTGSGLLDVTADRGLSGGLRHVGSAAPAIRDVYAPSVRIDRIADTYVRGVQEVEFSYQDGVSFDETPRVALRVECRLDSGGWSACSSPARLRDLSDGRHTFRVRVRDEAGRQNVATSSFVSDRSAPSLTITRPRGIADLDGDVTFEWRGSDPHSPVHTYDVVWRRARANGDFGPWRKRSQVSDKSLRMLLSSGDEACIRVRARNRTGYVSSWRTRCVGRPFDDASLAADSRWRLVTTKAGWKQSLTEASSTGARLSTGPVTGRRIAVLAQTCRGCGSVKVYAGGRYAGKLSFAAPRTRSRVWLRLPLLRREFTGKVRLVTTSRARVRIDGVLVRRT